VSQEVNSRTLDTHVSRIRNKLGLLPEHGWSLAAVYGHGYRLEPFKAPSTLRATSADKTAGNVVTTSSNAVRSASKSTW